MTHSLYLSGLCLRSQQDTTKTKLVSSGLNFLARFFINTLMISTDPILWVWNTKRDSKLSKVGKWERCCIFSRHQQCSIKYSSKQLNPIRFLQTRRFITYIAISFIDSIMEENVDGDNILWIAHNVYTRAINQLEK